MKFCGSTKIWPRRKNPQRKTLIPLPPTGFVSLFCANTRCGATNAPAHAGRGLGQGSRHYTTCKVLQKNVIALHSAPQVGTGGAIPGRPSPPGRKIGKPAKATVFKICTALVNAHKVVSVRICLKACTPYRSWLTATFVKPECLHRRAYAYALQRVQITPEKYGRPFAISRPPSGKR